MPIGMIAAAAANESVSVDSRPDQSLVRKGEVDDIVGKLWHLVVDECHHLSRLSFELVARRSKARLILGLSATLREKRTSPDSYQCGPVRHRVDATF